jgi:hypothetical protein
MQAVEDLHYRMFHDPDLQTSIRSQGIPEWRQIRRFGNNCRISSDKRVRRHMAARILFGV